MTIREIWMQCNGPKYRYIAANTLVSVTSLLRNLLFIRTLHLAALGQIALLQTLVMLIGFVQLGIINGAYIEYSAGQREANRRIVNLLTVGTLLLIPMATLIMVLVLASGFQSRLVWPITLGFGLAAGIATLASTWMNNLLVADGALAKSNLINVGSVALSVLVALLSKPFGLALALLAMLAQPLAAVAATLLLTPELRPNSLAVHRPTLKKVVSLGWIPFISMLMALGMHQIERWSIASLLGAEALGRFYIVLMYTTFFAVVPAALVNIFFPQAKRAYAAADAAAFARAIHRHRRDLFLYFFASLVITFACMTRVVGSLMPAALPGASLVYSALIWLLLFYARDTASLVLFCTERMRDLLAAGLLTLAIFVLLVVWLSNSGRFTLTTVLWARGLATLPGTVWLWLAQQRQMREFCRKTVASVAGHSFCSAASKIHQLPSSSAATGSILLVEERRKRDLAGC